MTAFYAVDLLGSPVYVVLWLFLVYSFLGVVVEVVFFVVCERVLESTTGLLYLPLRPLYGLGGCGFALLLRPVVAQPVAVFVLGTLLATVLEYLASLAMDTVFGTVSWDYSHKRWNVQGRVCLAYSLGWGALALVALYLLDRPLHALLDVVPREAGEVGVSVLMVLVLLSAAVTFTALARTRRRVLLLRARPLGGDGVIAGTGWGRLVDRLAPDPVLVNHFPRMTMMIELLQLTGRQRAWVRLPPRAPGGLVVNEPGSAVHARDAA